MDKIDVIDCLHAKNIVKNSNSDYGIVFYEGDLKYDLFILESLKETMNKKKNNYQCKIWIEHKISLIKDFLSLQRG